MGALSSPVADPRPSTERSSGPKTCKQSSRSWAMTPARSTARSATRFARRCAAFRSAMVSRPMATPPWRCSSRSAPRGARPLGTVRSRLRKNGVAAFPLRSRPRGSAAPRISDGFMTHRSGLSVVPLSPCRHGRARPGHPRRAATNKEF